MMRNREFSFFLPREMESSSSPLACVLLYVFFLFFTGASLSSFNDSTKAH
jgi:hypothetical protein